ncbi:hypothetical protein SAMN04488689_10223 [Paenibacillus sp. cl6col]|nr:hypothetical protein SAMN04488689_10223 [Paenibacillus sp. cl6col]
MSTGAFILMVVSTIVSYSLGICVLNKFHGRKK